MNEFHVLRPEYGPDVNDMLTGLLIFLSSAEGVQTLSTGTIGSHETMVAGGILPSEQIADVLDLVQTAQGGSPELDARIDCALNGRIFVSMSVGDQYNWRSPEAGFENGDTKPSARWSQDAMASLDMIPSSHNYSVGRRDGVCWAWIQPNDAWDPGETEYRHNHPQGSGLLVAYTMSLALMSAAMVLTQRLQRRQID